MGTRIASLLALVLVTASLSHAQRTPVTQQVEPTRDFVFLMEEGYDVSAVARDNGFTVIDRMPDVRFYRGRLPEGGNNTTFVGRLMRDRRVYYAEPDPGVRSPEFAGYADGFPIHLPFETISYGTTQYSALAASFATPADAMLNPLAEAQINLGIVGSVTRGAGVTVAVLDTGVQADHPSLKDHLLTGFNAMSPANTSDDVADGFTNSIVGHGTMVAGIIARMAPDAKILPVKVLNGDGNGSLFGVVRGLRWAINHGATVVNLSFGGPNRCNILGALIARAHERGVVIVAAAGNAGVEAKEYPAGYNGVLAVSGVSSDDTKTSFSNYGCWVGVSAPGSGITSTFVDSSFAVWSGTSFAAPFVAGAAALIQSRNPCLDADCVTGLLVGTARCVDEVNPLYVGKIGYGILNIQKSLLSTPLPAINNRVRRSNNRFIP